MRNVMGSDARSRVGDRKPYLAVVRFRAETHRSSRRCEFERIAEKVSQCLNETITVSCDFGEQRGDLSLQVNPLFRGHRHVAGERLLRDGCRIDGLWVDGKRAALDPARIEQVLNQPFHPTSRSE